MGKVGRRRRTPIVHRGLGAVIETSADPRRGAHFATPTTVVAGQANWPVHPLSWKHPAGGSSLHWEEGSNIAQNACRIE